MSTSPVISDVAMPVFQPLPNEVLDLIRIASRIAIDESDEADALALLIDIVAKAAVPAAWEAEEETSH